MKIFLKSIFFSFFAFVVNAYIYWGFTNAYTSKTLNYDAFKTQYENGVYQYRILSTFLLNEIYHYLGTLDINYSIFKLKFLESNADSKLYLSFFILNTLFLILFSIVFIFITETKEFIANSYEKLFLVFSSILLVGISQFVLVPYDISAYFFLLLFLWISLYFKRKEKKIYLVFLLFILVISTINRETSAISIPILATVFFQKYGNFRKMLLPVFLLLIGFIATYFGIRYYFDDFETNDGKLLLENLTLAKNYLGIIICVLLLVFSLMISVEKKSIFLFHLFSLPYIVMCFYSGILFEFRLYLPLFLVSILLGKIKLEQNLY